MGIHSKDDRDFFIDNLPENNYLLPEKVPKYRPTPGSLRIASLNCRGLLKSLDQLSLFLANHGVDIFGACETFLSESSAPLARIDGYKHLFKKRETRKHGGISMFVKHELATKIITDFDNLYEEMLFEFILVEIGTKSETLLCCVLYRPPCGSPAKFLDSLDKLLSSMLSRYKKLLFMGDFNIDLLAPSKLKQAQNNSSLANEFISSFLSTGMLPACRIPTRVTDTTASLIDNLFTNLDLKTCDVIIYDDSDHFLILSEVTLHKPKVEHPERKTRKLDGESIESLRNQLNNINRSPCLDNQGVDQATNYFIQEFEKAFDRACPAKTSKSRRQEPRKPWISKGIHFANVGVRTVKESLAANNSEQRNKFEDYLPPSSLSSLFLTPTSKEELINIVNLLKP
ncbi:hypothetical protein QYM36_012159, partial [Artemia franciscana]